MATDPTKINLCYPCGFFRPGDPDDPIAGEHERIDGAVWPKTAGLFWDELRGLNREAVCASSGGTLTENGSIRLTCLNEDWEVDAEEKRIVRTNRETTPAPSEWDQQIPFLILVYLVSARSEAVPYDMVLPRDLFKGFDLFRSSLDVSIHGIENVFKHDGQGFLNAARCLGGEPIQAGDAAARFHIFPKFPVDYILWLADEEFSASLTILVDRNAPRHLSADAIAVSVNLLSRRLCETRGPG